MLRWSGPLLHLERSQLELSLDLGLLKAASRDVPWELRGTFSHVPRVGAHPGTRTLVVGESNPAYAPLSSLPEHLVKAVLVSEDAGFFGHAGFEIEEVRRSLWDPDEKARHRGASTLSQQLAKNLFLDGERTYARKVREALSTIVLESALPKSRILELYLNIIEWGPGVYGIGEASQHYFAVRPSELTPKQSAFLASIIPNPARYHSYFERGELSEVWEARVADVLRKMRDAGTLTDEGFEEALMQPLGFRSGPAPGGP
jgi:membrane peptidoglycan carboxypeptidase